MPHFSACFSRVKMVKFWNVRQLQTLGNIGNIYHRVLKIFLRILKILYVMSKKYGVHMKFLSWIKNSSKTWNIAVNLTELPSRQNLVILTLFH